MWSTGCCAPGASQEVLQENVPPGRDLSLAASLLPVMGGFGGGWQGAAGRRAGGGRGQGALPSCCWLKKPRQNPAEPSRYEDVSPNRQTR